MLVDWMDKDHHQQIQHSVNSTDWDLEKVSPLVLVTHADGSEIRIYEPKLDGETKMEFSNWGTVNSIPSKKKFFDSLDEAVDFLCDFVRR